MCVIVERQMANVPGNRGDPGQLYRSRCDRRRQHALYPPEDARPKTWQPIPFS